MYEWVESINDCQKHHEGISSQVAPMEKEIQGERQEGQKT